MDNQNNQPADDQPPNQQEETAPEPITSATSQEPDLKEPELEAPEVAPELPAEEPKDELPAPKVQSASTDSEKSDKPADSPKKTDTAEPPVTPSKDVKGSKWYVVHTYSGHEAKVAATLKQKIDSLKLEDKVLDILVPTQDKIEIKEGKKTTVKEKIFPGYLLIRMLLDDDTWLAVRTTPGITSFVGISNQPTPLPDEEVASIQRFMHMEAPKFKTAFSLGEAVKITDGPFSEFLGTISEIDDEKGKIKVLVSIFGRETPVELDFLQVAKL